LQFTICFVVLLRGISLSRGCAGLCSHVVGSAQLNICQFMSKQVWSQWLQGWGEIVPTFLSALLHEEAFHGLGVQVVTEF
jgi:ribosome modulation factor